MRRLPGFLVLVCSVLLLWCAVLCAGGDGAGDAVHFMRSGVGARAQALGGAFTAVAQGFAAPIWNPAELAYVPGTLLGGSYESRFGGLVSIQSFGVSTGWESFGVGALYVSSDLYSAFLLSGAWGAEGLAVGGTGKAYWFQEGANSAFGLGVDLGVRGQLSFEGADVSLALVSQDIGWTAIRWYGPGAPFVDHAAWVTKVGAALRLEGPWGPWISALDVEVALRRPPREGEEDYLSRVLQTGLRLGMELWAYSFAGRVGLVVTEGDTPGVPSLRPTFGIGVQFTGVEIDAALSMGPLGLIYAFSTQANF